MGLKILEIALPSPGIAIGGQRAALVYALVRLDGAKGAICELYSLLCDGGVGVPRAEWLCKSRMLF